MTTTIHIRDDEAFARALDHIAGLQPKRAGLVALRDKELQFIQEKHDPEIAKLDEDMKAHLEAAETYATAYRGQLLPGAVKSSETTLAKWGFRIGQPVLKLLNRKHTWATVLDALKKLGHAEYVRTKEEPDKEALRRDFTEATLAKVGLRCDQAESFWVEAKVESGERLNQVVA